MIDKKTFEKQLSEGLDKAGMLGKIKFEMVDGVDLVHIFINPAEYFSLYEVDVSYDEASGEAQAVYFFDGPVWDELKEAFDLLTKTPPRGFAFDPHTGLFSKKYPCDKEGKWVQSLLDDNNESFFYFRAVWSMLQMHFNDAQDGFDYEGHD
jgi:hypothetical protein